MDRTAIYQWGQRFLPLFAVAARRHRRRVGRKWRVDETSCDFRGKQASIYRAIDEDGQVVDAFFSERHNGAAAQAFFERALAETEVTPARVTTDKAKCYPPGVLPAHSRGSTGRPADRSQPRDTSYRLRSPHPGRSPALNLGPRAVQDPLPQRGSAVT